MEQRPHREAVFRTGFYLFTAVLVLLFFSPSTSPLYPYPEGADSAIFQLIGKSWAEGVLPYRDLFDHKGPVIFFLNMLGYAICGNRYGVFLIQAAFFCTALYFADRLFAVRYPGKQSMFLTLSILPAFLVYYTADYCGYNPDGNNTEEYCLPFLMYFFFRMYEWLLREESGEEDNAIPLRQVFWSGTGFGVCLFTRMSNGLPMAAAIAVIFLYELYRKRYAMLVGQAVSFLSGTLCVTLPLILYFAAYGTLGDMWYAAFTYNFSYASTEDSCVLYYLSSSDVPVLTGCIFLLCRLPLVLAAALGFHCLSHGRKLAGMLGIVPAVSCSVFFFFSRLYPHYYIIMVPVLAFAVAEWTRIPGIPWKIRRNCLAAAAAVYLVYALPAVQYEQMLDESGASDIPEGILSEIGDGWDGTAGYNVPASWYLRYGLEPFYKYFTFQDWQGSRDERLAGNIRAEFGTRRAEYILSAAEPSLIHDILEESYTLILEEDGVRLYRRNM
jgi:hypothetical protein